MCLVYADVEDFMLDLDEHRRIGFFYPLQAIFCLFKSVISLFELPLLFIGVGLSKFEEALVLQTIENTNNLYFCFMIRWIFFDALIFLFLEFPQKPFKDFMLSVFVTFFIELYQALHNLTKQLKILNVQQHKRRLLLTLSQCVLCLLVVRQLLIFGHFDSILLVLFGYLLFVLLLV